ncbi:MAG: hypothetical protein GXP49_06130 [Deltaproteobacteria bacterium]|nr:hypothetical protein [Deltaproteobacteria bacterium]
MKAKWHKEVRELLSSVEFKQWWDELNKTEKDIEGTNQKLEEELAQVTLLEFRSEFTQKKGIDTLDKANDHEFTAESMQAEASELENKALEAVARFEELRFLVSDLWSKLGAREHQLEVARTSGEKAKVKSLEREVKLAREEYEREMAKKVRAWDDVERMWGRALEINLVIAENRVRARKVRRQSEQFFQEAERHRRNAIKLKEEAKDTEKKLKELGEKTEGLFLKVSKRLDCIVEKEFLYWQQRENNKLVWAVPLVEDRSSYNIEVTPLEVYQVDRVRGVEFVEPVPERVIPEQDDTRIDDFFNAGPRRQSG